MSLRDPSEVNGSKQTHTQEFCLHVAPAQWERGVMVHDSAERQEGRHRRNIERQPWGGGCTPLGTPRSSVRVTRLCTYPRPFCARKSRFSSITLQQNRDTVRRAQVTVTRWAPSAIHPLPFQSSLPFVLVVHVAPQVLASQEIQ